MFHYCYQITHDSTGRFYRGVRSSRVRPEVDPYLGSGTVIRKLVRKHGRDAFTKVVLSTHATRDEANAAEAELVTLEHLDDPRCLNRQTGGGGECVKSAATRELIREKAIGRKPSAESRAKQSAARLGNQHALGLRHTEETKASIRASCRAKWTPEARARQSATLRGRTKTAEHRAKIGAKLKGRVFSPETRARMSAAAKARAKKAAR